MLYRTAIIVHVQVFVSMVVVTGILGMHNQVINLACPLRHNHGAEHGHRLPNEGRQKNQGG